MTPSVPARNPVVRSDTDRAVLFDADQAIFFDADRAVLFNADQAVFFDADTFVRDAPSAAGRILGVAKRGHTLPYAGVTAKNGWMKVWYLGEAGWVGRGSIGDRQQGTGSRE